MSAHVQTRLKAGMTAAFSALVIACAFSLPAAAQSSDDGLLSEPLGEITFGIKPGAVSVPDGLNEAEQRALKEAEETRRQQEEALARLNDAAVVSVERQRELEASVTALNEDRKKLVDQLIMAAQSIQALEEKQEETEAQLQSLGLEKQALRQSLNARRAVLSEVMAALQRLGKNPPPALFVQASDALTSVRSAIVLGAVLPELRTRAERLVRDLNALGALISRADAQKVILIEQHAQLSEEQLRLDLLIKENQRLKAASEETLQQEKTNSATLASDASDVRTLIDKLNAQAEETRRKADKRRLEALAENQRRERDFEEALAAEQAEIVALARPDAGEDGGSSSAFDTPASRTDVAIVPLERQEQRLVDYSTLPTEQRADLNDSNFLQRKGLLPLPVRGVRVLDYGDRDDFGERSEGLSISTRANATVISPADGIVMFAGPFRRFKQLLILDVGGGYHVVMAGMDRIDVSLGDRVTAGEPVAQMGGDRVQRLAGLSTSAIGNFQGGQSQPLLYVEFRKDGQSINPSPWLAAR